MKIETKFNVNDLTQRKYDSNDTTIMVCEIIEIVPVVCIAGTQVFYITRPIMLNRVPKYKDGETTYKWAVERAIYRDNTIPKFREDELIPCSDEYKKIVLGK